MFVVVAPETRLKPNNCTLTRSDTQFSLQLHKSSGVCLTTADGSGDDSLSNQDVLKKQFVSDLGQLCTCGLASSLISGELFHNLHDFCGPRIAGNECVCVCVCVFVCVCVCVLFLDILGSSNICLCVCVCVCDCGCCVQNALKKVLWKKMLEILLRHLLSGLHPFVCDAALRRHVEITIST